MEYMSQKIKSTHFGVKSPSKNRRTRRTENSHSEYKYKIGFTQSVSTGIVALEGYVLFNDGDEGLSNLEILCMLMREFETTLNKRGYEVARNNAPKKLEKTLKSTRRGNHDYEESESV